MLSRGCTGVAATVHTVETCVGFLPDPLLAWGRHTAGPLQWSTQWGHALNS